VIPALAISPVIVTEKRSILPNREARSLRVKGRVHEDISILDKASENQLDRPSVVFIDDGFIEHSRQSLETELLLWPEPKIIVSAGDTQRLRINDAAMGVGDWASLWKPNESAHQTKTHPSAVDAGDLAAEIV
jgi:hypothetical protein